MKLSLSPLFKRILGAAAGAAVAMLLYGVSQFLPASLSIQAFLPSPAVPDVQTPAQTVNRIAETARALLKERGVMQE
ncbi:MAG: hypothetical protein JWM56_1075 [Candidatus Peribacteria bacterium]|nr:hypothetical protein [Candidatus Peribacteria bacterium]